MNKQEQENLRPYYEDYKIGIFKRCFFGFFMGISDGIPGYSGGTTLSIIGFYETLVFKFKNIFKFIGWKNWLKNLLWLLPFLGIWVITIFIFSLGTKIIVKNNLDVALIITFFSFAIFSVFNFYIVNKKSMFLKNQDITNITYSKKKLNRSSIIFLIIGFLIILGSGIGVYFAGGVSLEGSSNITTIPMSIDWIWLILSGFLAGFCMIIPGVSGSFILFLTGTYDEIYFVLIGNIFSNIFLIFLVAFSMLIGIIASIFFSSFWIKKNHQTFLWFCLGMVASSPIAILLGTFGNINYLSTFISAFQNVDLVFGTMISGIMLSIFISIVIFSFIKSENKKIKILNSSDALIVVDMQNDFSKKGKIPIKNFNLIAKKIDCFINSQPNEFKLILSMDKHPIDHFSFEKWPMHCVKETKGSQITEKIHLNSINTYFVEKGQNKDLEDYSAFKSNGLKNNLEDFLKTNKIKRVFIAGVMSDYCVKYTFLDSEKYNFETYCIEDLCSTSSEAFSLSSFVPEEFLKKSFF